MIAAHRGDIERAEALYADHQVIFAGRWKWEGLTRTARRVIDEAKAAAQAG